jgi:hypothetical protein
VRLWLELERLAIQCDAEEISHEPAPLWLNAEILRLELLVLSDACDSALWRSGLDVAQRGNLRSMSGDVLAAISFAPNALRRRAIERAQDRLFDEVLAQHSAVSDRMTTDATFLSHAMG